MNKYFPNKTFSIITILILIGVISRLIPHPPNLTAVGAVGLFLGAYSRKKNLFFIVPIAIMFISDLLLFNIQGKPFPGMIIYLGLLAYIPIGSFLIKKIKAKNVLIGSLSGATLFYLITNFSVWINTAGMYPYTYDFSGLINCYVAAIPFYMNSIAGNLIWATIIFGVYELSTYSIKKFSLSNNK